MIQLVRCLRLLFVVLLLSGVAFSMRRYSAGVDCSKYPYAPACRGATRRSIEDLYEVAPSPPPSRFTNADFYPMMDGRMWNALLMRMRSQCDEWGNC